MAELTVITSASTIDAYYKIGRLELLKELFGELLIPRAAFIAAAHALTTQPDWIHDTELSGGTSREVEWSGLSHEDVEAISLAIERGADLVLLDGADARKKAYELGLRVSGALGVLLLAKRKGQIPKVEGIMNELIASGFQVPPVLRKRILSDAGEGVMEKSGD